MTTGEAAARLAEYPKDTPCAYDVWLPEDVRQQAAMEGYEPLSDDQCGDVLASVQKHKDATIGISWDTISYHLSEVETIPPKEERNAAIFPAADRPVNEEAKCLARH